MSEQDSAGGPGTTPETREVILKFRLFVKLDEDALAQLGEELQDEITRHILKGEYVEYVGHETPKENE